MIDIKKLADIQPSLTGNEFSVLFYITNCYSYAQSIGLEHYEASYKQIREHTNIKDNHTIKSVIDHLVELGLITKQTEWCDEKNRKTKCKFTSSLVIPSGKNTLEIDSKSSGKIPQINKLNNINKSKLNYNTYNISPSNISADEWYKENYGVCKLEYLLLYEEDTMKVFDYVREHLNQNSLEIVRKYWEYDRVEDWKSLVNFYNSLSSMA